ncbi:TlpA family protein disulfide reductase [Dictyobacter arantiisoli]|uniref:Thioredoxin domain-containing protein n=1 Tax=Dictyobacter arantiisoli TaxID=2014874 RepID=A0A5A5TAE4_9CHLR|nr:TlpA disulfide reductase family protein [Dictyobacter arantiisoli]GCF08317.1 hypothetical protein KDI_18810 [Dictyobacter arantiisoli]
MEINDSLTRRSRKRNIIVFIVTNVLIVGLLVLLWTQLMTPKVGLTHSPDESLVTVGDLPSPLLGKPAPGFALPLLQGNGQKVSLSDFKGKPVLINFWASWCDPCNLEAPFLQNKWPGLQSKGIVMLGIDGGEMASAGQAFLKKYNISYTNVADTIGGNTSLAYGVSQMPETFFINADGKVVARWAGPLDDTNLQKELAKLHMN